MKDAHTRRRTELFEHFGVEYDKGLNNEQVKASLETFGKNELPEDPPTPLWELILEQFKDQLVIILLIAACVSFVLAALEEHEDKLTAFVEPIVIMLILIANATVGVIQESNAEKAIEALKEYSPDEAKVVRNGVLKKINATELVPGDIIEVVVGDKIPADARVIKIFSSNLRVDQAILTGESVSVSKCIEAVLDERAVKQDMVNVLFSGTTVVQGKARAIVTGTGSSTAIGDIHKSISSQISEKTPLKRKLDDFGDMLAKVITVICILVWLVNIRNFNHPSHHGWLKGAVYYFKIAVALAVAAIPEGLAVVITTCLALGTRKMAKKNAIVRSLPSVETLGCTSVICSDKTGTLTTNKMSVEQMFLVNDQQGTLKEYFIEGTSYSPLGRIKTDNGKVCESLAISNPVVAKLAQVCATCNESRIVYSPKDGFHNVGEPTEAAMKVLVEKIATDNSAFNNTLLEMNEEERASACSDYYDGQLERLLTFEFSRDRKSMSVLARKKEANTASLFCKGAPESILERCSHILLSSNGTVVPLNKEIKEKIITKLLEYGQTKALRCLALAYKENQSVNPQDYDTSELKNFVNFEQDMTFVGIVGMQDPPRPEVKEAIKKCKSAGIRVIVITGDNKNTAEAICRAIGIFGPNEDLTGKSYTGREFDDLSPEEKLKAVTRANLFSRTEPTHKSELVDLLQSTGAIVAMTGDGVNDAPALKKADIGVAMGSGTDVAKLAADMVLADDNFATIEKAVEEGRAIYNNTKQFIRYLISSNIGEVVSIFLTVLLGMPEALIPVQLLWVNLVTDGLPATALGFNPPDHDIMRVPPRSSREPIVGPWLFFRYMVIGVYVGMATVFGYAWWFMYYAGPDAVNISFYQLSHFHQCPELFPEIGCQIFTDFHSHRATTMSLSILVVIEMLNAMNSLSENESLLTLPLWSNMSLVFAITLSMMLHFMILYLPFFTTLFSITSLNWMEWQAVLLISLPVIFIDEFLKWNSSPSMCIAVIQNLPSSSSCQSSRYTLIVAGNRDEYYSRPTLSLDYWTDDPSILGGRDILGQGTWFAVCPKSKRYGLLTNQQGTTTTPDVKAREAKISRGGLIVSFLKFEGSMESWIEGQDWSVYPGFNLVIGDYERGELRFLNPASSHTLNLSLTETRHCISNNDKILSSSDKDGENGWPKMSQVLREFALISQEKGPDLLVQDLYELLGPKSALDRMPKDDRDLRNFVFVPKIPAKGNYYGTRTTSVLIIDQWENKGWVCEKDWQSGVEKRYSFDK